MRFVGTDYTMPESDGEPFVAAWWATALFWSLVVAGLVLFVAWGGVDG